MGLGDCKKMKSQLNKQENTFPFVIIRYLLSVFNLNKVINILNVGINSRFVYTVTECKTYTITQQN